jgi:PIN domain nuclease of toxin-antitoxin system
MKILLDTHVWIWALTSPARLPPVLEAALRDPDNELLLSVVSVWETLVLARKGRLQLGEKPSVWVREALAASGLRTVPLSLEMALLSEQLPDFPTGDPGDRFLVAVARVEGARLATADGHLLGYSEAPTLQ